MCAMILNKNLIQTVVEYFQGILEWSNCTFVLFFLTKMYICVVIQTLVLYDLIGSIQIKIGDVRKHEQPV